MHVALLSGFLRTNPFIISSIPDTALIPFAADYRASHKGSFPRDPGHNPVNRDRRTER
jgi:hypothetical protein